MTILQQRFRAGRFNPPAPVVDAEVSFGGGPPVRCEMIVDSGADTTVVPLHVAVAAGLDPAAAPTVEAQGFDGEPIDTAAEEFSIAVFGTRHDVWALVTDLPYGLLGRDVLREYRVTLDGPAGTLTVAG